MLTVIQEIRLPTWDLINIASDLTATRNKLMEEVQIKCYAEDTAPKNVTRLPVRVPHSKDRYEYALIDREDEDKVKDYRWRLSSRKQVMATKRGRTVFLTKLIAEGSSIHLNGDRLDCRKENLRGPLSKKQKTSSPGLPHLIVATSLDPLVFTLEAPQR